MGSDSERLGAQKLRMNKSIFASVGILERSRKPREQGITMLIDWGIPLHAQEDLLGLASEYIDLAKIAVGISALLEEEYLQRKIQLYQDYSVNVFPGGQFLELAYRQGWVKEYLEAVLKVGYRTVEVSDNIIEMSTQEKTRLIRLARQEYDMQVLGEVGKKKMETSTATAALIVDAYNCLDAGCSKIVLEAMEFVQLDQREEAIDQVAGTLGMENLIFELPGTWMDGIHRFDQRRAYLWLIEKFGPDVNIGNVEAVDIVILETARRGLGPEGWPYEE